MSLVRRFVDQALERRDATLSEILSAGDRSRASYAGISVNHVNAITNSAVWACINILVGTISQLPVAAFRKRDRIREKLPTQPLVVSDPSGVLEPSEWVGQVVHSVLTRGNAYGQIVARDSLGMATQIEVRSPDDVLVERKGKTGPPLYKIDYKDVATEDVFHVRGLTPPGGVVGISAIWAARNAIGIGLAAERYGAQWFGDGAHPSALLKTDKTTITEEQARVVKKRFLDAVRGTREPVVLGQGLTYEAIQASPEGSQLRETTRWIVEEVARFFNLSPEMVGAAMSGSSVTYANREQRAIDFVTFGVTPWLIRIEEPWTALLPRGQFVKFIVDALLRSDTKTRYEAHDLAIRGGWRSVNETRELEDAGPVDGGDEYLWPPYASSLQQVVTPS